VFGNLGNLSDILRQAGKMRETMERATEDLGRRVVEAEAGGGAVRARFNARLELLGIRIDPKLVQSGDAELIEELVSAAITQAMQKAREEAGRAMQEAAGMANLNLPGLDQFFGGGRP
jgi:DNA-binding YbaB/EbfC family protein